MTSAAAGEWLMAVDPSSSRCFEYHSVTYETRWPDSSKGGGGFDEHANSSSGSNRSWIEAAVLESQPADEYDVPPPGLEVHAGECIDSEARFQQLFHLLKSPAAPPCSAEALQQAEVFRFYLQDKLTFLYTLLP